MDERWNYELEINWILSHVWRMLTQNSRHRFPAFLPSHSTWGDSLIIALERKSLSLLDDASSSPSQKGDQSSMQYFKQSFAFAIVLATLSFASNVFAQDHGEVGAFADYFRFTNANDLNLFGVGGRVGVNVHSNIALEVEGAYDFERSTDITINALSNTVRTGFRATHFLAGPKFTLGAHKAWHLYGVLKGGFVRFGVTPGPVTAGNFPTALSNTDLNGVFYPGGGVEAFAGILGLRAEIGDEIYFDHGANNNLKITVGPVIRF